MVKSMAVEAQVSFFDIILHWVSMMLVTIIILTMVMMIINDHGELGPWGSVEHRVGIFTLFSMLWAGEYDVGEKNDHDHDVGDDDHGDDDYDYGDGDDGGGANCGCGGDDDHHHGDNDLQNFHKKL